MMMRCFEVSSKFGLVCIFMMHALEGISALRSLSATTFGLMQHWATSNHSWSKTLTFRPMFSQPLSVGTIRDVLTWASCSANLRQMRLGRGAIEDGPSGFYGKSGSQGRCHGWGLEIGMCVFPFLMVY